MNVRKIINIKKTEIRYNSEWLKGGGVKLFLELAKGASVQQILKREDFKKRLALGNDVSVLESLYPLFQGYDSVAVKADVEIGGRDQKLNLLMGRRIQRFFGMPEQDIMTFPLIEGTDGVRKMSKSYGNYVALDEKPNEMFGKIMSIPDPLMESYFNPLTSCPGKNIAQQVQAGELHPRDAKKKLAVEITGSFYGEKTAILEAGEFDRIFRQKQMPDEMVEFKLSEADIWIVDLLRKTSLVESGSQARALIQQGAVTLNGEKVTDAEARVRVKNGAVLKAGKRRFVKLIIPSK